MKILWDENKRLSNLDKHGFDFADLEMEFFEINSFMPVKNSRYKTIGFFKEKRISVIFHPYGQEAISVISMRIANKSEEL